MATCPSCRRQYPEGVETCEADGERLLPDEVVAATDADLTAGQMVGEYRVESKLGEGGFGAVYRAVHPVIGKAAAVKVLHRQFSSSAEMVSRFIAEARAVNQIRHRNIIDIFSFGTLSDGRQYYVMELLDGMTLDRYIRTKTRLAPEEAIGILRQVARALAAAHAVGIAHRDLKPENVFLSFDEDGGVFPKLLDFGIAKLMGDASATHKTRTGAPIGTPNYMSPEQCRGKNVDVRTDIYSFGVLTHEALTGRLPFSGDSVMDVLIKHTTAPPPPMSSVCPDLGAALDAPVLAMLEKEPAKRPDSVAAALESLAAAANAAGYAVTAQPVRPADSRSGTSRSGESAPMVRTPSGSGSSSPSVAALAEARTVAQASGPTGRTLLDAEKDVGPGTKRGAQRLVAIAAIALAGIGVGIFVVRTQRSSTPPPPPPTAIEGRVASQPAPPPTAAPTPLPTAAPAAAPDPSVEIRIQSEPKQVDVYLGSEKLGTAPDAIRLKRGDAAVKLTLKAEGFRPTEIEVMPSANTVVSAKLDRAAPAAKPRAQKPSGDLENPF